MSGTSLVRPCIRSVIIFYLHLIFTIRCFCILRSLRYLDIFVVHFVLTPVTSPRDARLAKTGHGMTYLWTITDGNNAAGRNHAEVATLRGAHCKTDVSRTYLHGARFPSVMFYQILRSSEIRHTKCVSNLGVRPDLIVSYVHVSVSPPSLPFLWRLRHWLVSAR